MEKKDRLQEELKALEFSFRTKPFSAKYMMSAEALTFGYDPDKPLIKDLSLTIRANDRICIVAQQWKGENHPSEDSRREPCTTARECCAESRCRPGIF